jgi:hypothetical protein
MSEIQAKIAELEAEMVGATGSCDCRPTTSTTIMAVINRGGVVTTGCPFH